MDSKWYVVVLSHQGSCEKYRGDGYQRKLYDVFLEENDLDQQWNRVSFSNILIRWHSLKFVEWIKKIRLPDK